MHLRTVPIGEIPQSMRDMSRIEGNVETQAFGLLPIMERHSRAEIGQIMLYNYSERISCMEHHIVKKAKALLKDEIIEKEVVMRMSNGFFVYLLNLYRGIDIAIFIEHKHVKLQLTNK